MSVDPLDRAEETTERVSLDLPVSTVRFLERFAAYRNVLNEEQKLPVKRWTRKSAAEAFVVAQVRQVTDQLQATTEELGPIPDPAQEEALRTYVRKVMARIDKSPKKSR